MLLKLPRERALLELVSPQPLLAKSALNFRLNSAKRVSLVLKKS